MKKILACLLACALLLPTFAACNNEQQPAETTAATVTTEATTTADPNAPELPDAEEIGDISGDFHILVERLPIGGRRGIGRGYGDLPPQRVYFG